MEYAKEEIQKYAKDLERELEAYKISSANSGNRSNIQAGAQNNILVEWQLNLDKELELLHHQIRGHVIKRDEKGNEYWAEPDDEEQRLLNEKGAQEVEKIVRNYLNKNLLLSNYDLKVINQRVSQFAHRLRRFLYLNYEDFGLTTYYKQKHFEMLVMNIVDMVESAYLRALNGGERESLTSIRQIIQSENFDSRPQQQLASSGQKKGFWGKLVGR